MLYTKKVTRIIITEIKRIIDIDVDILFSSLFLILFINKYNVTEQYDLQKAEKLYYYSFAEYLGE